MSLTASPARVPAELGFSRPEDVSPDPERPGLLRVPDVDVERPLDRHFHSCRTTAEDCAALEGFSPDLVEHGFARADLSGDAALQAVLERVRAAGRLEKAQAAEIRRRMAGRSLPLSGGRRMKVLFVAGEGFLMRKAGPNGISIPPDEAEAGMNAFDGARGVHADQDVRGTPLRQLMRGAAPWLFHHEAPDSRNTRSPLFLLNVWIPLEQITRPLCLMDPRTLDRRRHQLRLGLKVDSFLERKDEAAINHIWSFLHDEGQRWWFTSELDARTAYVFETLATPHASFIVPGEDLAEQRFRQLGDARTAVAAGDGAALSRVAALDRAVPGEGVPASLRQAIADADALLAEAGRTAGALARGEDAAGWRERAERTQQRFVRKSIEMRAVALVTRDAWPFNRGQRPGPRPA